MVLYIFYLKCFWYERVYLLLTYYYYIYMFYIFYKFLHVYVRIIIAYLLSPSSFLQRSLCLQP